jgi:hypothetical protein
LAINRTPGVGSAKPITLPSGVGPSKKVDTDPSNALATVLPWLSCDPAGPLAALVIQDLGVADLAAGHAGRAVLV